jgi:hypothetical protein
MANASYQNVVSNVLTLSPQTMKIKTETVLTAITILGLIGLLSYNNWEKSKKIQELETTIRIEEMYKTLDELKSGYKRENIKKTNQFVTMNDSLKISFVAEDLTDEKNGVMINFNVNAISKLPRAIKYIYGILTVKDDSQIIVTFPMEITPDFIPNSDTTFWRQSLNLERYIAAIKEKLKTQDIRSLNTEWKTKSILFHDNSAIILNESSE